MNPDKIREQLRTTYDRVAEDFSASRKRHWPEMNLISDGMPHGAKVLDLGCGDGRLFEILKVKKVDYTGVDFSRSLLELAKKKYPQQEFIEQDITKLDLNRRYDRIVLLAAFHHIPGKSSRQKTLKNIGNHLNADGVLIISVWNLWQWRHWKYFLIALVRSLFTFFREDPRDLFIPFGKEKMPRYYHAFFPFELKRLLQQSGFSIRRFVMTNHNFLFFAEKSLLKGATQPVPVSEELLESLQNSAATL